MVGVSVSRLPKGSSTDDSCSLVSTGGGGFVALTGCDALCFDEDRALRLGLFCSLFLDGGGDFDDLDLWLGIVDLTGRELLCAVDCLLTEVGAELFLLCMCMIGLVERPD